jgi:hypothetical protein
MEESQVGIRYLKQNSKKVKNHKVCYQNLKWIENTILAVAIN